MNLGDYLGITMAVGTTSVTGKYGDGILISGITGRIAFFAICLADVDYGFTGGDYGDGCLFPYLPRLVNYARIT